jgi:Ni,Fe-hydrogenase I cytochrome b subunit
VLLFVGLQLATVVSAFAIKSHPIYFVVFFITQLIILNVVPIFTQLYTTVYDHPTFALYASQFNWVKLLIDNLTLLTMIFSFVVAIAMFGLPGGGGGREG